MIVPFQHAAAIAVDVVPSGDAGRSPILEKGPPSIAGWEHAVASLSAHVRDLEENVRLLTAIRVWEVDGRRIDTAGAVVPSRVIAEDSLPWRSSLLLSAGRRQGIPTRGVAVSDVFNIAAESDAPPFHEGSAVLYGEVLVGWIEELFAESARVKCVSDPSVEMKVLVGRIEDQRFQQVAGYFWLVGAGRGRMFLREVDRRLTDEGEIRVGDLVLSDPENPHVPIPMVIGRVVDIESNRENPLLSILTVRIPPECESLRRVYVFDPAGFADRSGSVRIDQRSDGIP